MTHSKDLTVGKRLQLARNQLAKKLGRKISQEDLANLCGWPSQARISHYENDRRVPKGEDLMLLSKALIVAPEWILFGTGKIHSENSQDAIHRNFTCVPFIEWEEIELWPSNKIKTTQHIPVMTSASLKSFALRVNGDSMCSLGVDNPSFPEGSIIIVDPLKPPKHRSFIVYKDILKNMVDFRQLSIERNVQYLKILNPNYPNLVTRAPEEMHVLGTVTEVINIL